MEAVGWEKKAYRLASLSDQRGVQGDTCIPLHIEEGGERARAEPRAIVNSTCHLCWSEVQPLSSGWQVSNVGHFWSKTCSHTFPKLRCQFSFSTWGSLPGSDRADMGKTSILHRENHCHDPTNQDIHFPKPLGLLHQSLDCLQSWDGYWQSWCLHTLLSLTLLDDSSIVKLAATGHRWGGI